MANIVVVGGGFAGCAAAAAARKAGANVTLLERMEILGGCGLLAGQSNPEQFPVREELRLMGAYDIFGVIDGCTLHEKVSFRLKKDGRSNIVYDATRIDWELLKHLQSLGVKVRVESRAKDVVMEGKKIRALVLDSGEPVPGDVFIDASGGAGGIKNCQKYGHGCVMCFFRCPAYGDRVSIADKAGVKELKGLKRDGTVGPMSAAFALIKDSLSPELQDELKRNGCARIPLPPELVNYKRTENITASANIDEGFAENIILVDNGYAKRVAAGYTPLEELRQVRGLEHARFADPYAGSKGNAVRFMALTPRNDALEVPGVDNLFVASEKVGVSNIPAVIITGVVAGHNAVRKAVGKPLLVLPRSLMMGDFLAFVNERWNNEGLKTRFSAHGGPYLRKARENGLYTEDKDVVQKRVQEAGLVGVFSQVIAR